MRNSRTPHIVQYQGSKRILAPKILRHLPERFNRLVEPFAGMAAITIATAREKRAPAFWINDFNAPLAALLREAVERPDKLAERYATLWKRQFTCDGGHIAHFYEVREEFNAGKKTPENILYLLARCVKGSVRYGKNGNFNQSPDKRRHGVNPETLACNIYAISGLLKGRTAFSSLDYADVIKMAEPGDVVYMDPPYQGVSDGRDNRYISGVQFSGLVSAIEELDRRNIDYIISYDGKCGKKEYGSNLPESLRCHKVLLNAETSTQATLLGRKAATLEALYVSDSLFREFPFARKPQVLPSIDRMVAVFP